MNRQTLKTLTSSVSKEWGTPIDFFQSLQERFGKFDLDPCTTPDNPLNIPYYYTIKEDGLRQQWKGQVYCNPPYGKETKKWIQKALNEVNEGHCHRVVMLLPARTDCQWFHQIYNREGVTIEFLKGRLKFRGSNNSAPFPSILVIID